MNCAFEIFILKYSDEISACFKNRSMYKLFMIDYVCIKWHFHSTILKVACELVKHA